MSAATAHVAGAADRRQQLAAEVVIGRDGFLFHRWDHCFEQVCGQAPLDAADLRRWVTTLESRHAWCRLHGIPYVVLVVPERHVVYADKLPPGMTVAPGRPVAQIRDALAVSVRPDFLYPEAVLRHGRAVEETFFHTDIHWSRYGAFLGYRALAERMSAHLPLDVVGEHELVRTRSRFIGDLGMRLEEEPMEDRVEIAVTRPWAVHKALENKSFTEGQVQVFVGDRKRLPRIVMFRDSNATHLIDPFLFVHFSRIVSVGGARQFFPELVLDEKPDIVVTEIAERYFGVPVRPGTTRPVLAPHDLSRLTFSAFTGLDLPLPVN